MKITIPHNPPKDEYFHVRDGTTHKHQQLPSNDTDFREKGMIHGAQFPFSRKTTIRVDYGTEA